jgi:hypothetical protein
LGKTVINKIDASFEAFMAVLIQVEVFWIVTPDGVAWTSEMLVSSHITHSHNPEGLDVK